MAKILLHTLIFLMLTNILHAQKVKSDTNITGHVTCKGEHVAFINITVAGTTIGTSTDATGHYSIVNLPAGDLTVQVGGMGYKQVAQRVALTEGRTLEVNFEIEEDALNIESVVITADRNMTNRSEATVIVNTVTPRLLEMTQSVNVAEALCFSPGLRTENNCQNCGFTQLRMNGLEGPYTQILLNSRPVFSGLAGVYGLELIPANMIERMEIVRGGGSALFGGNAIAGTVNIITKEPSRNLFEADGKAGITGAGIKNDAGPAIDRQLDINASMISDDRKTGGYIYAMLRDRDSYDVNNDGFTEMVELENTTFGFNVFHKPGS